MSSDAMQVEDAAPSYLAGADAEGVQSGYKRTAVGVIPADWDTSTVDGIASAQRNAIVGGPFGSDLVSKDYVEHGVPVIRGQNMDGKWVSGTFVFVTFGKAKLLSANLARPNDLVFTQRGTLGQVSLVPQQPFNSYLVSQSQMKVTLDRDTADPVFIFYIFSGPGHQKIIREGTIQTGVPHINLGILRAIPVQVPCIAEQHAIAEALSDVDALLGALEALIAKKRAIKQAAMQQLLTGKTRLPGFSGEWETKRLGNVLTVCHGKSQREVEVTDGPYPILATGGQIGTASFPLYDKPSVLIGRKGTIDRPQYMDRPFWTVDTLFYCSMVDGNVAKFFFYRFCLIEWKQYNEASGVPSLNARTIEHIEVACPKPPEQSAIAAAISDMDAEIAALEARWDKTRAIKQGMMQQLLSGRVRLVKPAVAASEKAMSQLGARRANVHFVRSVLAAEIIDRLHEQPTFGHVKFEKMMFLIERLCEVDTGSTYHRKAAGPYDNRALRSIDSQLRKQQWFDARKEGKRYQYVPMQMRGGHKQYFDRYFSGTGETFDKILGSFKTLNTERCEIVATLLAAWSDLLRKGGAVSDQLIVQEVLNNWHEAKRRIPKDRWLKALDWMRSQGFVPKGTT